MSIDEQTEEPEHNDKISIATLALLLFLVSSPYHSVMRLRWSDSVAPLCIGCFLYRAIHLSSVDLDVTLESGLQCPGVLKVVFDRYTANFRLLISPMPRIQSVWTYALPTSRSSSFFSHLTTSRRHIVVVGGDFMVVIINIGI